MPETRISADGKWILTRNDDGSITRAPADGGMPADPAFQYEGQIAAGKAGAAQFDPAIAQAQLAKAQQDAARAAALQPYDVRKAAADAAKAEAELLKVEQGGGDIDPQKLANLRALEQQIVDVRALYDANLRGGNIFQSIGEYLPTQANKAFDSAGKALAETGFGAFRTPGVGSQSDAEGQRFVEAYAPSASDFDSQIEQKLANLESRLRATYQAMGIEPTVLGPQQGRDDAPLLNQQSGGLDRTERPLIGGGGPAVPQKRLGTQRNYATDEDIAYQQRLEKLFDSGASLEELSAASLALGRPLQADATLVDWIARRDGTGKYAGQKGVYNKAWQAVGRPESGQRSDIEIGINKALLSPAGTAATTATNALGFGALQALAPEALAQQRETNPMSAFGGDVAGMLGGTAAISRLGTNVANRFAPNLLTGGGRAGSAARAIAPDAAYGALYGGVTEGDPLSGAATAALGSGAGQLLGKGIGKAASGFRGSPEAQMLDQAGIPVTVGQRAGGFLKSIEDAATSAPILGDIINARRAEGLEAFNLKAMNEAGMPIGATVNQVGEDGFDALKSQVGDAYTAATSGVRVPLDATLRTDMQAAAQLGAKLPPDFQVRFDQIGKNRLGPIMDEGVLTGDSYQQAMRGLKNARSTAAQAAPGFEQDYRDAVTAVMGGLRGQMERGGGQRVVEGLGNADAANRLVKTIEAAQIAAKNDVGGAGIRVFTPAQLNTAAYATQRKYNGERPFAELGDAGQTVLPNKIPDSGTARRGASLLLPASLGGAGYGIDQYATGTPTEGAASGLTLGALLLAGGTKKGQKLTKSLLFDRGARTKKALGIFGSRKAQKGLGSMVAAPLLIQ